MVSIDVSSFYGKVTVIDINNISFSCEGHGKVMLRLL